MTLYDQPVRTFPRISVGFILLMASSPGFGSDGYYLYFALFTLGFPITPPQKGLVSNIHQLVGSFFNRHAVIPTSCDGDYHSL